MGLLDDAIGAQNAAEREREAEAEWNKYGHPWVSATLSPAMRALANDFASRLPENAGEPAFSVTRPSGDRTYHRREAFTRQVTDGMLADIASFSRFRARQRAIDKVSEPSRLLVLTESKGWDEPASTYAFAYSQVAGWIAVDGGNSWHHDDLDSAAKAMATYLRQ